MVDSVSPSSFPDCVPARIVNEYAYCPRLAYIEWVQADFAESADTLDGEFRHRVVDQPGGEMPPPEEAEGETIHARSVWLSAAEEMLTAKIDLIESGGESVTPVEYKRGSVPETPERSWEPDRVQLCAQGLILRENGYRSSDGVLYYSSSKTRVPVTFDTALIARTRDIIRDARAMAAAGQIPPPLEDSRKCPRSSLAGICLPDETRWLALVQPADAAPAAVAEDETIRRLMPARDDALPLYVQEQGARVSKSGEVFEVSSRASGKLGESRIFETSHIALFGNVQITTQALQEAVTRGIPVSLFTMGGWFYGLAHGMSHRNVEIRIAQYRTAADPARCLRLAAGFVEAKIRNSRTLAMRNHPDPPQVSIDSLARLAREAASADSTVRLLGLEAMAAKTYFALLPGMLKPRPEANEGFRFDFHGRNRRPPRDPVNAMLSLAYSLLAKDLTVAALIVGLDPFLGFFHQPRYGRPSLALDLMEEFRTIIADSTVLSVVNNGMISPADFRRRGTAVAMEDEARKKFIRAYENRMDTLITHPLFGYKISYRRVLEVQMRLLARVLTGELTDYPSFTTR